MQFLELGAYFRLAVIGGYACALGFELLNAGKPGIEMSFSWSALEKSPADG